MKNILVVKLSAIGDVIHALPVSYAIKETYPDAHLTWVVEPPAYPLLEGNPYIDELILFEKAKFRSIGGFLREYPPLRRRLRAHRYDVSLDLQGLFKSAAIVYTAGARERVGTANMRGRGSCESPRARAARTRTHRRALSRRGTRHRLPCGCSAFSHHRLGS